MATAYVLIRAEPHYRRDAFASGLRAVGYEVRHGTPSMLYPSDLVLGWNRYGTTHDICTRAENAGATTLIAENGYLNPGGSSPHSDSERQIYSLAIGAHNDDAAIAEASPERWAALGIELRPWRTDGAHVLICPNRSFGTPGRIMPSDWVEVTVKALRRLTDRPIRIRPHPGNSPAKKPLSADLAGAHCVIQWHSSAGVHALIAGIPVLCMAPAWICKSVAGADLSQIEAPPMPDRLPAMQRLANGQFSVGELSSGEAFRRVLADRLHPAG